MSRIVLENYDNGDVKYVVGWDRPLQSFFWQHFHQERNDKGRPIWEYDEDWQEMVGFAGYMNGEIPTVQDLINVAPDCLKPLITPEVKDVLVNHRYEHPDPGRVIVDMTKKPPTVERG